MVSIPTVLLVLTSLYLLYTNLETGTLLPGERIRKEAYPFTYWTGNVFLLVILLYSSYHLF